MESPSDAAAAAAAAASVEDVAPPSPIRFRPSKKRKATYRQRGTDDAAAANDEDVDRKNNGDTAKGQTDALASAASEAQSETAPVDTAAAAASNNDDNYDDNDNDGDQAAVAAALRLRNARKHRLGGVGFRSDARNANDGPSASRALVLAGDQQQQDAAVVAGIANRFTHQTGLIGELNDKHMTEYIESRLSSRHAPPAPPSSHNRQQAQRQPPNGHGDPAAASRPKEQPVLQGKLMEVDISEALRDRGRSTGAQDPFDHQQQPPAKRPRLGKDGKPWRPRNRRGSDDVKRDQLVEEFLHENRLDVYDVPAPSSAVPDDGPDADGAADERLAEQFRKQYYADVAQRRQRRRPAQPAKPNKPTNEDVLKGPKLGGSRNSRAAMRDLLLKKEKEEKKARR